MFRPEAIINKKNLIHNINYIKNFTGSNVNIMPVVKADAYGHGVIEICKILSQCGIKGFCVASALGYPFSILGRSPFPNIENAVIQCGIGRKNFKN